MFAASAAKHNAVREFVNESAASAASLAEAALAADLITAFFAIFGRASGKKITKNSENL